MSFSHISHASMKTLVAGIAAAATLCTGAIATMQTANAADASTAPSVAGHAYNDLPVAIPTSPSHKSTTVRCRQPFATPSGRTKEPIPPTTCRKTTIPQTHPP